MPWPRTCEEPQPVWKRWKLRELHPIQPHTVSSFRVLQNLAMLSMDPFPILNDNLIHNSAFMELSAFNKVYNGSGDFVDVTNNN
jgi:hypothetical protein